MALAFVDDSGSGGDAAYYVLAGYVASIPEWGLFVDQWQAVLDLAPRLEYFKMNEAHMFSGQFSGFTADQRKERLNKFIDVILGRDLFEWSVAIPDKDYREVLFPSLIPSHASPYYAAFIGMVTALSGKYRWSGSDETVDFVFDEQDGMETKMLRLYRSFRHDVPQWRLGEVAYRSDRDFLPLQAADLIAWQTRRFFCAEAKEPTREELKRLHSKYRVVPRSIIKRNDLVDMARSIQDNVPKLIEEHGEVQVERELSRLHARNQKKGIETPLCLSERIRKQSPTPSASSLSRRGQTADQEGPA